MKFCHPSLDRSTTNFAAVIRDDAVTARDAAEGGTHGMPHIWAVRDDAGDCAVGYGGAEASSGWSRAWRGVRRWRG
jgi:hypothetical protein